MIAITNHPKTEANHFIDDSFEAGIRFVIFSEESYLETKAFGEELGLDTTWNSCISLSNNNSGNRTNIAGARVLPAGIEEIK
mmetsp:Transcript_11321/g.1696  ORF Transcript_11321/g.1696 Transcript_11321/m.1696 type:complete len:82 (+) Transcript_11321:1162-1407(+)